MPHPPPKPSPRIGRYVLLDELGHGGMGTVFLARMEGVWQGYERLVALKTIHQDLAERSDTRQMFFDEIRIASRLNHPNVAGISDFGETEALVWYTMDYVHGISVSKLLDASWPSAEEVSAPARWPLIAAHIVADACEGLHFAHELVGEDGANLQIVHRDVSPANLVVGYDGITRVVDFGIASALDRIHRTATGEFRGKLPYASPEHLEGKALDRRTDVWALGVVLWEMCAKHRPFPARSMSEALKSITSAPIPALSDHCSDLPEGLDEIAWKCLQRDPERRFETAQQVGDELRIVLAEHLEVLGPGEVTKFMAWALPNREASARERIDEARRRSITSPTSPEPDPAAVSREPLRARSASAATIATLGGLLGLGIGLALGVLLR